MTGSDFCALLARHQRIDRGRLVLEHQESWLEWPFVEVALGPGASCFVASDYFAIGTGANHVRIPLDAPTAQLVADRIHMMLPTSRIVDATWKAAGVRLTPAPRGTATMLEVSSLKAHDATITADLQGRPGLVAGHKKDVVIGRRAHDHPGRVAIYGWTRPDGHPIQQLSTVHEDTYADYSHGLRLVRPLMQLRGELVPIADVAAGAEHALVSSEGPLTAAALRYPVPASSSFPTTGEAPNQEDPMPSPAPACQQALRDASARWPDRSRASDGIMGDAAHQKTKSDHNDGLAVDITHDPAGCSGDVIAAHAILDARVTYVIWQRQIHSRDARGWRAYTGANPHTKHVHISIRPAARRDTTPWGWAPPATAPAYPGKLLGLGLTGQYVRAAQERLVLAGASIAVDGDFGKRTLAAVRAFQVRCGLEVDGLIGPATWARLWA